MINEAVSSATASSASNLRREHGRYANPSPAQRQLWLGGLGALQLAGKFFE